MTIRLEPSKRAAEVRTYRHDWSPWLGTATIVGTPAIDDEGVTVSGLDVESDLQHVQFKVSGGTPGQVGRITQTINTSSGDVEAELFLISIVAAEEPVSVAEAKQQLRIIDDDSQDALIMSYIRSARAFFERETGYIFVRRQFVEAFNSWPRAIHLSRQPLISVDEVTYRDADGAPQAFTDYVSSLDLRRIVPASAWPQLGVGGAIIVKYTAGFDEGEQADEVELARQAIFTLVTHWFQNREAVIVERVTPAEVPFTITALIDRLRGEVL